MTTLPSGTIIVWSGSTTSIPAGFNICDGTNGTPNLLDRFVVGAGNDYTVGQTGDWVSRDHDHGNTGTIAAGYEADPGSHYHSYSYSLGATTDLAWVQAGSTGRAGSHGHPGASGSWLQVQNHNHPVAASPGTLAAGGPVMELPLSYVLAYIMKL